MPFFSTLVRIIRTRDLRNRILFVLGTLVLFRVMAHIPVPGVDLDAVRQFFSNNQIFSLLNLFSGGGFTNLSVVMLGVGPFINASIIFQLLTVLVPSLEKMQKEEGEEGRRKINQWTRYATIPLAALQAYGFLALLQSQGVFGQLEPLTVVTMVLTVTAGSVLLMWMGELMTEKGVGNGLSLIIFAGIAAGIPTAVQQNLEVFDPSQLFSVIAFIVVAVLVIAGVVFVTEGQRNIPVTYARRMRGDKQMGGNVSHLPLRVNQAGVMPIIFAISILLLPGVIASLLVNVPIDWLSQGASVVAAFFQDKLIYGITYFVFVVLFTYFYTSIAFDPKNIAEHMQKNGGFIPGIRPGKQTETYLGWVSRHITLAGALFLGAIAVLPLILQQFTAFSNMQIGGTALLIVVSVVLETVKQVESQLIMRDYETF